MNYESSFLQNLYYDFTELLINCQEISYIFNEKKWKILKEAVILELNFFKFFQSFLISQIGRAHV